MNKRDNQHYPLVVRDCALVTLAVGVKAQSLREFRDGVLKVHQDSLYHHFWGRLLQPQFDEPEFNNDFASWIRHGLHEKELAERLAVVDPTHFQSMEDLRSEIVEIIEERLDESEFVPYSRSDQQFYFLRSQIIILDTGRQVKSPEELKDAVPSMSTSSIFYHFVDSRRRNPNGADDFSHWLSGLGSEYDSIIRQLAMIDPYFSSLRWMQWKITEIFREIGEESS